MLTSLLTVMVVIVIVKFNVPLNTLWVTLETTVEEIMMISMIMIINRHICTVSNANEPYIMQIYRDAKELELDPAV